jgi:hypothetical protein
LKETPSITVRGKGLGGGCAGSAPKIMAVHNPIQPNPAQRLLSLMVIGNQCVFMRRYENGFRSFRKALGWRKPACFKVVSGTALRVNLKCMLYSCDWFIPEMH